MKQTNSAPKIRQGWLRALAIVIPFVVFFGIFQMIGFLIYGLFTGDFSLRNLQNADMDSQLTLTIQFFTTIGTLLLIWIFCKTIDRKNFPDIGLSLRNQSRNIFYGLFAGFVMMGLGTILLWGTGNLTVNSIHFNLVTILQSILLFTLVSVNEEVFVRGYILPNLMDSMNRYMALILSSLLFAGLHMLNPGVSFLGVTNIFLAGLLLGVGYIFTKNLWFPLALHFSWNFFQGPIFGFEVSGNNTNALISQSVNGSEILTGGKFGFEGSFLASILYAIALVIFWFVYSKQEVLTKTLSK